MSTLAADMSTHDIPQRVAVLENQVADPQTGIIGQMLEMRRDFRRMEARIYVAMGIGGAGLWVVEHVLLRK